MANADATLSRTPPRQNRTNATRTMIVIHAGEKGRETSPPRYAAKEAALTDAVVTESSIKRAAAHKANVFPVVLDK